MKIINIPFLNRGPKIETSIGIFVVIVITLMMFSTAYSAYKKFTNIVSKNTSYTENSEIENQPYNSR